MGCSHPLGSTLVCAMLASTTLSTSAFAQTTVAWGLVGFSNADRIATVTQLSVGAHHTAAILPDGSASCWGDNRLS